MYLVNHLQELIICHIISFTCWMAGLFYLPRLFIYHEENFDGVNILFQKMEYRLYTYIMVPSLMLTVISGGLLALATQVYHEFWFVLKVIFVLCMIYYHFFLNKLRKDYILNIRRYSSRTLRIINEIPTIIFIIIVILVIKKP
jgi:putative membrane protein